MGKNKTQSFIDNYKNRLKCLDIKSYTTLLLMKRVAIKKFHANKKDNHYEYLHQRMSNSLSPGIRKLVNGLGLFRPRRIMIK